MTDLMEEARKVAHAFFRDERTPIVAKFNAPWMQEPLQEAIAAALAAAEQRGREEAQKVSRADLAAGWEIVGLPREGQHICWVIDPAELIPTLQSLIDQGTMIGSVLPVAAIRRGDGT